MTVLPSANRLFLFVFLILLVFFVFLVFLFLVGVRAVFHLRRPFLERKEAELVIGDTALRKIGVFRGRRF